MIGGNDVSNADKSSPIYGMPVIDVEGVKTVLFIRRSKGASALPAATTRVFHMDNAMMLLADAKKMVEEIEGGGERGLAMPPA